MRSVAWQCSWLCVAYVAERQWTCIHLLSLWENSDHPQIRLQSNHTVDLRRSDTKQSNSNGALLCCPVHLENLWAAFPEVMQPYNAVDFSLIVGTQGKCQVFKLLKKVGCWCGYFPGARKSWHIYQEEEEKTTWMESYKRNTRNVVSISVLECILVFLHDFNIPESLSLWF